MCCYYFQNRENFAEGACVRFLTDLRSLFEQTAQCPASYHMKGGEIIRPGFAGKDMSFPPKDVPGAKTVFIFVTAHSATQFETVAQCLDYQFFLDAEQEIVAERRMKRNKPKKKTKEQFFEVHRKVDWENHLKATEFVVDNL